MPERTPRHPKSRVAHRKAVFGGSARLGFLTLLALGVFLGNAKGARASDLAAICDRAAAQAAIHTGVPISVLKAISLTETGREAGGQMRPWPWTVNMEGKGLWFDTEDAARAYVYEHFKRGARSFDVGCFQINYKWHHQAFVSIEEMFDPTANANYAAEFLLELFREKGNWEEAAGAYHSRTPEHAEGYIARFAGFREQLRDEDGRPLVVAALGPEQEVASTGAPTAAIRTRVNSYPLLQAGGGGALGSLVPLSGASRGASLFAGG